jgi:hypothetical protein
VQPATEDDDAKKKHMPLRAVKLGTATPLMNSKEKAVVSGIG